MIIDTLRFAIDTALSKLDISAPEEVELEHPADLEHGDYATNIALQLAGREDTNPRELAEKIIKKLEENLPDEVASLAVAGPGFINFHLSPVFFAEQISAVLQRGASFGNSAMGADRTVIVEYSSPNIAKPFSVGHLRSTVIGDAVANILAFTGHSVIRDNHLGDWGTQFGKVLYALDAWGDIEKIENSSEPVKDLVALYVKFHKEAEEDETLNEAARAWFARMEEGDGETRELLDKLRTWSLNAFAEIYDRLGVSFDSTHGESKFMDFVSVVKQDLEAKDMLARNEGAKLVYFEDEAGEEVMPPLMIEKSDGTSTYAARDLATDKWRRGEYGKDITIINEVGSEQTLYFKQLFETEELLGYFANRQRHHLTHGLFRFKDGKMSTRAGNVIWLEEIIDEARQRAEEFNDDEEVAEAVAIGAIKFNDLKRDPIKDIVFSWDEVLNLEGNSGPYLQYTHARAKAVLKKAESEDLAPEVGDGMSEATEVEKLSYRFPEVVERAARDRAPRYVANYLYDLAQAFNTFYGNTQIVSDEPEAAHRLAVTAATAQVLENGLKLLGIKAPEEM
jgi:arginyl-tRNA synthetase